MSKVQKKVAVGVTARVLVACQIAGLDLKPNQLVQIDPDALKAHEKDGRLSADEAGVSWCLKEYPGAPIVALGAVAAEEEAEGAGSQGNPPEA